ncbi:hypothetical protein BJF85_20480 [Saccharomonospora sp. CUA-673]|nr:hypothetical protein BJF85_20480 [Saccharomonospora sp. CUA-673]
MGAHAQRTVGDLLVDLLAERLVELATRRAQEVDVDVDGRPGVGTTGLDNDAVARFRVLRPHGLGRGDLLPLGLVLRGVGPQHTADDHGRHQHEHTDDQGDALPVSAAPRLRDRVACLLFLPPLTRGPFRSAHWGPSSRTCAS